MSANSRTPKLLAAALAIAAIGLAPVGDAGAALTDIATVPVGDFPSAAVRPNLMYILDDSGSMTWNYMPDQIFRTSGGLSLYNCKKCTSSSCGSGPGGTSSTSGSQPCGNSGDPSATSNTADYGEAPFYSSDFNKLWYNPDFTYAPGVDSTGTGFGNADPSNASNDYYLDGTRTNLLSDFKEVVYCNTGSPSSTDLRDPAKCRRNGVHNVAPFAAGVDYFLYWGASGANVGLPTTAHWSKELDSHSNPHYFTITPHEYCADENLVDCALATAAGDAPNATNTIEAPLRWCKSAADAISTSAVTGNAGGGPRCQKKFDTTDYKYPRYGRFRRVDIVPGTASYPIRKSGTRTDCASPTSCTYAEEIQNFANWWTYYSNRMALMKTATGRAFLAVTDRTRVGFITINPNSPVTASKYVALDSFNATQKLAWYTKLYSQRSNGSTPNRTALHRVGRHYAGLFDGINNGMTPDPIQYSCQQNFAFLTTDGYWNDNFNSIGNHDNVDDGWFKRDPWVGYDGGLAGASNTLADVAAYYYKTDLRTSGPVSENNVPTIDGTDENPAQHMVTFTLGLGVDGYMRYKQDYQTSTTGDFYNIKKGTNNACSWTTGVCNWPVPAANDPSTLDDLWHAAVNGKGRYFNAGDPNSLTQGLESALADLNTRQAAASATAVSSPIITASDNMIFNTTFRIVKWDGEVVARRLNPNTGLLDAAAPVVWSAQAGLDSLSGDNADSRNIFTIDEGVGGKRTSFTYANLSSIATAGITRPSDYFDNKCTALSQCALLTATEKNVANDGTALVNYLRGWRKNEKIPRGLATSTFRARDHLLGDPVNGAPAYLSPPKFSFVDDVTSTYADFKIANQSRQKVLFVPANDGMLHAFNADTGVEMWAYVPRIVMPRLHKLATANWSAAHEFNVDGSPTLMDAYDGGSWRTILVSGLNGGGRGYFALDVTAPANPTVLWEICADATVCKINDPDIGLTFANPVITKRASDGKWVVLLTSGYNNVSPGTGRGYLYVVDVFTGKILQKVDTGVGDTTTPSGFGRLSVYADNFPYDNTGTFAYGGDLLGNVWKFDLNAASPTRSLLATLKDGSGVSQPITTRPELASIDGSRVVFVGTGRLIGLSDKTDLSQQSLYAIKDRGASLGDFRRGNVVQNFILTVGAIERKTTANAVDWGVKDGWFVDFNPGNASPGERVNVDPFLALGRLLIAANVPNDEPCSAGGDSWVYLFDIRGGNVTSFETFNGPDPGFYGGGKKETGKLTVGVAIYQVATTGRFIGDVGLSGGRHDYIEFLGGGSSSAGRRVSWRELIMR